MKTKAAILRRINQPLSIESIDIPDIKPGQVLVKIAYSGICHTQLNEIRGKKGADKYIPHTLGHEGSGVVFTVGEGVKKVKKGDHVVLTWIKGEGADVPSAKYSGSVNSGAISTFMTYAVISENRLVPIPKDFSLKEAALLGCAVPTGAGIIFNTLKAKPENSLAIIGLGGIGLSALIGAKSVGLKEIIAVDILDWKLDFAKRIGATQVINAKKEDIKEKIKNVDFVIESAGVIKTMEIGLSLIHNGGTVVIAGNLAKDQKIAIDPFELIKGKKIIGTWGGETMPDRDIPFYVSKKLDFSCLISKEYGLEDINQAFTDLEKGKIIRALINLNEK